MRISESRLLIHRNPELIKEWDFEKNEANIDEITYGSRYNAHWICEKGHTYQCPVGQRSGGTGCSYCSGLYVWIGFNDMWTTNPMLARMLADPEDGYKYTQGSKKRVDWKCPSCESIKENRSPMIVKNEGLCCPTCSNSRSYGERLLTFLLLQIKKYYITEKTFKWSNRKRFDFYVPEFNLIIEVHGSQHYERGFDGVGGKSLEEEQANDQHKYKMAMENGIKEYIVIDCRKSDFEFIKDSIMSSKMSTFFELSIIDWEEIRDRLKRNKVENIIYEWNSGLNDSALIAKIHKMKHSDIKLILDNARVEGLCNYHKHKDLSNKDKIIIQVDNNLHIVQEGFREDFYDLGYSHAGIRNSIKNFNDYKGYYWYIKINEKASVKKIKQSIKEKIKKNTIVQINLKGEIVKEWINAQDILEENINFVASSLNGVINRLDMTYRGYIWLFKEYYSSREGKRYVKSILKSNSIGTKKKSVLQLDLCGNILNTYESVVDASKLTEATESSIRKCITGKRNMTKGYIWIYQKDYLTKKGKDRINLIVEKLKSKINK